MPLLSVGIVKIRQKTYYHDGKAICPAQKTVLPYIWITMKYLQSLILKFGFKKYHFIE